MAEYDVVVVGTGFGGLAALYFLKQQGLSVKAIDRAKDVGGTWYWNQYPGARSDVESFIYRLSIDKDLLLTDEWKNNYVTQPELSSYFQKFASRNGLYEHIQFETELKAATWSDETSKWQLQLQDGQTLRTKYLVTAIGILHRPTIPSIQGLDTFKGRAIHSSQWSQDVDEYASRRVAVIGSGASGVQLVGSLSQTASHLTHFVRHAQFVIPTQLRPIGPEERSVINARYDTLWTEAFASAVAMGFTEPNRPALSVSEEDRQAIYQSLWEQGSGFRFLFGGFSDLAVSEAANQTAIDFIHGKIREIVKDENKAKVLLSSDWFARRPLTDDNYYKAFNQSNVAAIDLKETPITEIVPEGIKTSDGKVHEVDLIVFATGFDAVDGGYYHIDFTGRDGRKLQDQWADGPVTTFGLSTSNFPNLFFVNGPGCPFGNNPPVSQSTAQYSAELIARAEELRKEDKIKGVVESTPEADTLWTEGLRALASQTLFAKTNSWFFGENIAGRKKSPRFWFGGLGTWRAAYAKSKANDYEGFKFW